MRSFETMCLILLRCNFQEFERYLGVIQEKFRDLI